MTPQLRLRSASAARSENDLSMSVALPTGAAAGILGSMAGIGGGLVIIPALRMATKLPQVTINGTALLAGTLSCTVGAATYTNAGVANVPVALILALGAVPLTGYGTRWARSLPDWLLT
eukprot:SAG31_NODE_18143_length_645_cov_1.413919_1_plen_118_part_01